MTREQVKTIFTDVTDEQLSKLLDINTADIGKAKGDHDRIKTELETANVSIKSFEKTIDDLKKSLDDGEDFKSKFETLEKQVAADKERAEKSAQELLIENDNKTRFNSVVGERKWRDELTEGAVYEMFKKALKDESSKGKGDKDILENLTNDKNYFENPNAPSDMPGMGNVSSSTIADSQMRAIMGLPPSKEWFC